MPLTYDMRSECCIGWVCVNMLWVFSNGVFVEPFGFEERSSVVNPQYSFFFGKHTNWESFMKVTKWLVSMSKYAYVKFFQIKYKTTTKNVIGYIIKAHITAVDDFAKRCKSEAKILYQKIWASSSQALIECVKCICVMDTRVDMLRNARRECSWWCSTQQIDTK